MKKMFALPTLSLLVTLFSCATRNYNKNSESQGVEKPFDIHVSSQGDARRRLFDSPSTQKQFLAEEVEVKYRKLPGSVNFARIRIDTADKKRNIGTLVMGGEGYAKFQSRDPFKFVRLISSDGQCLALGAIEVLDKEKKIGRLSIRDAKGTEKTCEAVGKDLDEVLEFRLSVFDVPDAPNSMPAMVYRSLKEVNTRDSLGNAYTDKDGAPFVIARAKYMGPGMDTYRFPGWSFDLRTAMSPQTRLSGINGQHFMQTYFNLEEEPTGKNKTDPKKFHLKIMNSDSMYFSPFKRWIDDRAVLMSIALRCGPCLNEIQEEIF